MANITVNQLSKGTKVVINPQRDRSRSVLVEGVVDEVLTRSNTHPHGILVSLESGEKGRVKLLVDGNLVAPSPTVAVSEGNAVGTFQNLVIPPWLKSENPYFARDIAALKVQLNKTHEAEGWRELYYDGGICGCLQEMTKLIEKSVESIFKMPIILSSENDDMATLIYGRPVNNQRQTYRFASSTDLLAKLKFVFNDSRKKEKLIDLANYIDSDLGLLFRKIDELDNAAVASLNAIRNYRNYLSHPQNDVLSESKTRFVADYSLVDFKEIFDLDTGIR